MKKDGTLRECFDAEPALKSIQERIKMRILRRVSYPYYLMGGISDPAHPRDHLRNAAYHSGARVMANLDIADFFPSISSQAVSTIWQRFFGFSEAVAKILTALTTHRGMLPQGAKTSSHLANLAFWRSESQLVERLQERGIRYSRFIDDITISSPSNLSREALTSTLNKCFALIYGNGFRTKRSKQRLTRAGDRMDVTGVVVGKTGPSLAPERRARIRAAVHRCEIVFRECGESHEFRKLFHSTTSMVGQMSRLHQIESEKLKLRLAQIRNCQPGNRIAPR